MKLWDLQKDFGRCGITAPKILCLNFNGYKKAILPNKEGIYSIWCGDECIYVGKGGGNRGIKERLMHHFNKAKGTAGKNKSTKNTGAWKYFLCKNKKEYTNWTVEYCEVASPVHRAYLEGVMLLLFQPRCNNENFSEWQRRGNQKTEDLCSSTQCAG